MSWSHLIEENRDLKTENAELRKLVGELVDTLKDIHEGHEMACDLVDGYSGVKCGRRTCTRAKEMLARATELLKTTAEKEDSHA